MIWITADWHFSHDRDFIWQARGFNSVQEMNETIVKNYNSLVGEDDDVYVLGDLMLGGPSAAAGNLRLVSQMNGRLHLVRGNHDTDTRWRAYAELPNVVEQENAIYLNYNKYHFYLSHFPTLTSNFEDDKKPWQRTLSISGHCHSKNHFNEGTSFNACVDAWNCRPVQLNEVIKEFDRITKETWVKKSKELNSTMRTSRCDKCVWYKYDCAGPDAYHPGECPLGHSFKRDPLDGGYYG